MHGQQNIKIFVQCFRACFLPGQAKDLSAPRYSIYGNVNKLDIFNVHQYITYRFSVVGSSGLSVLQPA